MVLKLGINAISLFNYLDSEIALSELCNKVNVKSLFIENQDNYEFMDSDHSMMTLALEISLCHWKKARPKWAVECPYNLSSPYECLDLLNDSALSDYWKTFTHVQRVRQHVRQEILSTKMNEQSQQLLTLSKKISENQLMLLEMQTESNKDINSIHKSSDSIKNELELISSHIVPIQEFLELLHNITVSSKHVMRDLYVANSSLYYIIRLLQSTAAYIVIYAMNRILVMWSPKLKSQVLKIVSVSFIVEVLFIDVLLEDYCFAWRMTTLICTTPVSIIMYLSQKCMLEERSLDHESEEAHLHYLMTKLKKLKKAQKVNKKAVK